MERQIDTSIFISREGTPPGHVGIPSVPEATFHHRRQKSRHVARAEKKNHARFMAAKRVSAVASPAKNVRERQSPTCTTGSTYSRFIGTK